MKKVVCITGVAGGIGAATAVQFLQAGWSVVGVDRVASFSESPFSGSETAFRYVCADLANPTSIQRIFDDIRQREKRLDALVNNAAVQLVKNLVDTEPDEWDTTMAVNVRAVYLTMKHAYPLLRVKGGSVVNVSSVHAFCTSLSMAAYAASKGAIVSLTRAAAIEMGAHKIRVNAILPGATDTPMLRSGLTRDHAGSGSLRRKTAHLASKHVLGRIGDPDEIAAMVLVLADDRQSSFMTGQCIVIDGGATAKLSTE